MGSYENLCIVWVPLSIIGWGVVRLDDGIEGMGAEGGVRRVEDSAELSWERELK